MSDPFDILPAGPPYRIVYSNEQEKNFGLDGYTNSVKLVDKIEIERKKLRPEEGRHAWRTVLANQPRADGIPFYIHVSNLTIEGAIM